MRTVIASMNERDTLPVDVAAADLRAVLTEWHPDIIGLQEWPRARDGATERVCAELGYQWTRPAQGGGPILWCSDRYRLRSCKAIRLSRGGWVGRIVGRRSRLGASWVTEVVLDDTATDSQTAVLNFHLTAGVQKGDRYRRTPQHRLRVRRHKRERRRLSRRGRWHLGRGRTVYLVGDTNYDGLRLRGFVNCWLGHKGGTLQGRAVDIVFAAIKPNGKPRIYKTRSDHRAVCCTYKEKP